MKPRRWRRRLVGALVVAITATLAWADPDTDGPVATPRLIGLAQSVGSAKEMTVTVQSSVPFSGRIVGNCGAAPAMRVAGGTGDPFVLAPNAPVGVAIECPSTLAVGMHRCSFEIRDTLDTSVASFEAFCATFSNEALTAAPLPVSFSDQQVGVTSTPYQLAVTNPTGMQPGTFGIQVDNPNFIIGKPCQDQTGCDAGPLKALTAVDVLCRPLSTGTHQGQLFLVADNGVSLPPVPLTCATGSASNEPVLTVTPPNISLSPAVEVTGGSAGATVELANGGAAGTLTITSLELAGTHAGDWSFSFDGQCQVLPCALGAAQKLDVRLTFDPSGFNARPATLVVNYADPAVKQTSVSLAGDGVGATVELVGSPSIDFGVIPLNTQAATRTFKLQNSGNRETSVMLAPALAPFSFPMSLTLSPGETTVNVGCFSMVETLTSGDLSISGPDATAPLAVPLRCEVRDTLITATPSSITFDELRLGSTPSVTVTIDRVGAGAPIGLAVALETPTTSIDLGDLNQPMTLATTKVKLQPTGEGELANRLIITPSVGQPVPVPISATVVEAKLVAPDVMTLGTYCVGQPVGQTAVTLQSVGTATVQVTDVALELGATSPFDLEKSAPATYPTSLPPTTGLATVLVTPKRSDVVGDVADALVWSTDAGEVRSMLTTRFIEDGGAIAPAELDFHDVPIHLVNDDAQAVTLQNCSTDPLQLLQPVVPAPFELTGEFPLLLEPAAKATFSILFLPREVGPVTRELTIESMGGDVFTVALRGNGVTGDPGAGDDTGGSLDETSFYACGCRSAADPSGMLLIALAMLCSVRRRVSR